jgi:hypothetical protein
LKGVENVHLPHFACIPSGFYNFETTTTTTTTTGTDTHRGRGWYFAAEAGFASASTRWNVVAERYKKDGAWTFPTKWVVVRRKSRSRRNLRVPKSRKARAIALTMATMLLLTRGATGDGAMTAVWLGMGLASVLRVVVVLAPLRMRMGPFEALGCKEAHD